MATLVRWEPFRELATLQNEMSRFIDGLGEGNGQSAQGWVPTADVWETADEVVYAFDLPGIPEDKVSVELEDGALTITGEREREHRAEDGKYFRFERRFGTFSRALRARSRPRPPCRRALTRTPSQRSTSTAFSRFTCASRSSRSRARSR